MQSVNDPEHDPNSFLGVSTIEPVELSGATAEMKSADSMRAEAEAYRRYTIETSQSFDLKALPNRFLVKVGKFGLAKLLAKEFFHYFGKWDVVFARPCVYGVFSGPAGGFMPRPNLCVGCLRCTIQHPEFVTILHNPKLAAIGDSYFDAKKIHTIHQESEAGAVPVKGQGYRGRFGGRGWDGMWTDMSEIIRPTRDGIHGRETISTLTDLGSRSMSLHFDSSGRWNDTSSARPRTTSIQLPMLFDMPPLKNLHREVTEALADAALRLGTLVILPYGHIREEGLQLEHGAAIAPLIALHELTTLLNGAWKPAMIESEELVAASIEMIRDRMPSTVISLRISMQQPGWMDRLLGALDHGYDNVHLVADYHGRGLDADNEPGFMLELLIDAHKALVRAGIRDRITLSGSGGIIQAEHVPKAIICGLDAIALDTSLFLAMQAEMIGECISPYSAAFKLPKRFNSEWGTQRIINLMGSWRDQLLEIMGAMGLREVRRLRGELGRAMFQQELEMQAFAGIEGFAPIEVTP